MSKNEPVIIVKDLNKSFKLPHEQHSGIKQMVVNIFNSKRGYEKQEVLKNISFEVKEGDFFGIVGRNGSGKSTLLKLLAGIYSPESGLIHTQGSLVPFIELGVGFNPELTGRENIFLNGALLGFSKEEMENMYEEIVEFAELDNFMDQKLKNYSSGMQVRLAFSIAIRARGDILLLDEVLAVGDSAFQEKCFSYFEKLKKEKKTVILVTHDMEAVKRFCNRAIFIKQGVIENIGTPEEIADDYTLENMNPDGSSDDKQLKEGIKSLEVTTKSHKKLSSKDQFIFEIDYQLNKEIPVFFGISVMYQNISVLEHNSRKHHLEYTKNKRHKVVYKLPLENFNTNSFKVNVSVFKEENLELMGYKVDACSFFVVNPNTQNIKGGPMLSSGEWSQ